MSASRRKPNTPSEDAPAEMPPLWERFLAKRDPQEQTLITTLLRISERVAELRLGKTCDALEDAAPPERAVDDGATALLSQIFAHLDTDADFAAHLKELPPAFGDGYPLLLLFKTLFGEKPKRVVKPGGEPYLTPRQASLLSAACITPVRSELAQKSGLTLNGINAHFRNIYKALGVHTQEEAIARAYQLGYLTPHDFHHIVTKMGNGREFRLFQELCQASSALPIRRSSSTRQRKVIMSAMTVRLRAPIMSLRLGVKQYGAVLALVALILPPPPAWAQPTQTELIKNGGFETGDFTGWATTAQAGSPGAFQVWNDIVSPSERFPTAGPAAGTFYALTDSLAPGTDGSAAYALIQRFTLPVNVVKGQAITLRFDLFVNDWNGASALNTDGALDYTQPAETQFARVDLLTGSASPFSSAAADVVRTFYAGTDGTEPAYPYTSYSFDIGPDTTPGQVYQLRFASVQNVFSINVGVDNVSLSPPSPRNRPRSPC